MLGTESSRSMEIYTLTRSVADTHIDFVSAQIPVGSPRIVFAFRLQQKHLQDQSIQKNI